MSPAVSTANASDSRAPAPDKAPKNKRCVQPSTPKTPFSTKKHTVKTGNTIAEAQNTECEIRSGYSPIQGTSIIPGVAAFAKKFLKSIQKYSWMARTTIRPHRVMTSKGNFKPDISTSFPVRSLRLRRTFATWSGCSAPNPSDSAARSGNVFANEPGDHGLSALSASTDCARKSNVSHVTGNMATGIAFCRDNRSL